MRVACGFCGSEIARICKIDENAVAARRNKIGIIRDRKGRTVLRSWEWAARDGQHAYTLRR
jgi:hypothetical protein